MQAEEGAFSATREVDELHWLSLAEASAQLTRTTDREVLERFARGVAPSRTVLLVRHASAGSASTWKGDDRDRPLDECGIAQADELVRRLSRFEVGRVVSADIRRCVDTVAPVAEALGLEVELEPLLGEVAYPGREEEAVALVRHLGDVDVDAIACSQGDVIPDLVGRLATADGLALDEPIRSGKGSTWALTLDAEGHLVAADYLEPPRPSACTARPRASSAVNRAHASERGTSIQKVDPMPSSELRPTAPPCASAMWRTIARPRPALPPSSRASRSRARDRSTL